ncbi:phosphonate transport system substrate-binding protein [Microbacterium sp. oral taxon 186 str. F0373]|jgi:phosphonate transport system substrate-binding protein|uniref:phosphate/phosphite/phosphonate ABC transporter substrate-binding protein n=1 Tax=Microbacterium sp. oral taxon 186 TaxID=712383 RepID=UPI0002588AD2|nr:phosphate/phosphite/phosphonate ABC transporter substrate-binding protein [Microbacterium sp. oral taxon 186]EIC08515.1 phosphonate ABC transporter, periplasmic phosphonate-binding protein [Microbacterium laevaniformans OR221]EPD84908.1 phosphonate transport system substrate-binding protein [Microbacterium sp. oral taxon 186 str. F0373]
MRITRLRLAAVAATALAATVALAGCSGSSDASGSAAPAADPTSLVLALVPSQDQAGLVDTAKPLTDMLSSTLGIPVTGVVSKDYQAAVEAMGADQAQIGFLPSLQLWQASDRYGAKVVLQTERNGAITYPAQFMTNNPSKYCSDTPVDKDGMLYCNGTDKLATPSGLDAITKIAGAKVAVLGPGSPAGYIYPMLALKEKGIDIDNGFQKIPVTANDASVMAVYKGDAEVGFSFWDARTLVKKDTPDVGQKVVVFALSDPIPNDGVAVSSKLSPALQDKITQALESYSNTDEGSKVLKSIYSITKLAPANPASLDVVARAAQQLGLQ